jgi:hypothetical protein
VALHAHARQRMGQKSTTPLRGQRGHTGR